MKHTAAALGKMDRFHASQTDVPENFRFLADRREHIGLVGRRALIGEMKNRLFAPRERRQVNGGPRLLQAAVMAGELTEGSFFLFLIRLEKTFEHKLGVRRHL